MINLDVKVIYSNCNSDNDCGYVTKVSYSDETTYVATVVSKGQVSNTKAFDNMNDALDYVDDLLYLMEGGVAVICQ